MSSMPNDIETRLAEAAPAGIHYRAATDDKNIVTAWCTLASADDLLPVARLLKRMDTRLSTVTVFQPKAATVPKPKEGEEPAPLPTFLGGTPLDGKTYEILVPGYTYDGGHLNEVGASYAAAQFVHSIAGALPNRSEP